MHNKLMGKDETEKVPGKIFREVIENLLNLLENINLVIKEAQETLTIDRINTIESTKRFIIIKVLRVKEKENFKSYQRKRAHYLEDCGITLKVFKGGKTVKKESCMYSRASFQK